MKNYIHLRQRDGRRPALDGKQLRKQLAALLAYFWKRGYLEKAFGIDCVDGPVPGERGDSLAEYLSVECLIHTTNPVWDHLDDLSDLQVLAIHEALHDLIAKPLDEGAEYHSYNECGWHHTEFDEASARTELRERANRYLALFEEGYVLGDDGTLRLLMDEPASVILGSALPETAPTKIRDVVESAVRLYQKGTSSWDEREAAVRQLANALEPLRESVKSRLGSKDESDLFNLLNNFAIRHLNDRQRVEYDRPVFLTWLFYELLAAIHACLGLAARDGTSHE